eukprot:UN20241
MIFVGNQTAASTKKLLLENNITYVVNCTDNISNFHARDPDFHYLRFKIAMWWREITSKDEDFVQLRKFLTPLWEFIGEAMSNKKMFWFTVWQVPIEQVLLVYYV